MRLVVIAVVVLGCKSSEPRDKPEPATVDPAEKPLADPTDSTIPLAQKYPDPGVPATATGPHVRATQVGYLGDETDATAAGKMVIAIADRFGACFAMKDSPPKVILRLGIAKSGTVTTGALISVIKDGSTSEVNLVDTTPEFHRCVIALGAAIKFPPNGMTTRVDVELIPAS